MTPEELGWIVSRLPSELRQRILRELPTRALRDAVGPYSRFDTVGSVSRRVGGDLAYCAARALLGATYDPGSGNVLRSGWIHRPGSEAWNDLAKRMADVFDPNARWSEIDLSKPWPERESVPAVKFRFSYIVANNVSNVGGMVMVPDEPMPSALEFASGGVVHERNTDVTSAAHLSNLHYTSFVLFFYCSSLETLDDLRTLRYVSTLQALRHRWIVHPVSTWHLSMLDPGAVVVRDCPKLHSVPYWSAISVVSPMYTNVVYFVATLLASEITFFIFRPYVPFEHTWGNFMLFTIFAFCGNLYRRAQH